MQTAQLYAQPFSTFPARDEHDQRWTALAREIAARRDGITDDPAALAPPAEPGELVVIGSGIEAVGFTAADEMLIREADHVFFCVADPATSVWLKALRPDAYDLYVLYDDTKLRHLTYMQMTEAILHYVRAGQKVVAVYYGHPGIFVLSTHRAVRIARREGHRATMRAGVSALDTLCADLGVDPSQPGMQTFEATDMLIRRRVPDTGLHLVLWQVGLIGELGYRRHGYLNSGFGVLLDYLEEVYGAAHPVINYVGSRYPGTDPVIDEHTVHSLRQPEAQATVTAISTFYLPPRDGRPVDEEMLRRLGLLQPGQTARTPPGPLRIIDRYGVREMRAFDDFARFRVPAGYHWQEDTAAARFILALREDAALRDGYVRDPGAAVAGWGAAGLGPRERTLLARRDAGAMQIAAKGLRARAEAHPGHMLRALLTRAAPARALLREVRRAGPGAAESTLARWAGERGWAAEWPSLHADLERTLRGSLYPWTGLYAAQERRISIFLLSRPATPASGRVYVNGSAVKGATYSGGALRWRAEDGNPCSGYLQADVTPRGARRLVGAIWPAGATPGTEHNVALLEHRLPDAPPLAAFAGRYRVGGADVVVRPESSGDEAPRVVVQVDGGAADPEHVGPAGFSTVGGLTVPLSARMREEGVPAHLRGVYVVRMLRPAGARLVRMRMEADRVCLPGGEAAVERRNRTFAWSGGPGALAEGEVTALLDPITLRPMLFGAARAEGGERELSLAGMVPVDEPGTAALAAVPALGLPAWAWEHLVRVAAESSRSGGLFLWHGWHKAQINLRRVRAVLREVHG